MMAGCWHWVALTRRGLRVRNVFMKLSPGGLIPPPKTFQHLIRKKGIRVFVDFRNGLSRPCLPALAGFAFCRMKPIRRRRVLTCSGFRKRVGVVIPEVDLSQFAEDAGAGCATRAVSRVDDVHAYADAIQRFCESTIWVC